MSIIFIAQVVASSVRIIYKASTMKGKSKSFLMLASTCTIATFLIKGGLSELDNKMMEYLIYKDNEKNIVIYFPCAGFKTTVFRRYQLLAF